MSRHTALTDARRAALEWAAEALRLNRCDVLRRDDFRAVVNELAPKRAAHGDVVGCAFINLRDWLAGPAEFARPMRRTEWEISVALDRGTRADVDFMERAHHARWLASRPRAAA